MMQKIVQIIMQKMERYLLLPIVFICFLISVFDFFGALDNISFISVNIPTLTLLLSSMLGIYIINVTYNERNSFESEIQRAIKSVNGLDIKRFENKTDMFKHISRRYKSAKDRVDDLSWGCLGDGEALVRTENEKRAFADYLKQKQRCATKEVEYREVMTFSSPERIERAEEMLKLNKFSYNLKGFSRADNKMPRLVFTIIDSSEVIFVSYKQPHSTEGEIRMSIKHKELVKLFQDYFDAIWLSASLIKEKNEVDTTVLEDAKQRLQQTT